MTFAGEKGGRGKARQDRPATAASTTTGVGFSRGQHQHHHQLNAATSLSSSLSHNNNDKDNNGTSLFRRRPGSYRNFRQSGDSGDDGFTDNFNRFRQQQQHGSTTGSGGRVQTAVNVVFLPSVSGELSDTGHPGGEYNESATMEQQQPETITTNALPAGAVSISGGIVNPLIQGAEGGNTSSSSSGGGISHRRVDLSEYAAMTRELGDEGRRLFAMQVGR